MYTSDIENPSLDC